jgi:hypothetical protein
MKSIRLVVLFLMAVITSEVSSREYHVSVTGSDKNDGSASMPYKTISAAAQVALPCDIIIVHSGTYRERVTPPRGGESDIKRIIYRAAEGEKVEIKGSEKITNWSKIIEGVWKVSIPNSLFREYNPYTDIIGTDWFTDRGRVHHTGEVFLNGKSLYEVVSLENILNPKPLPYTTDPDGSLYVWYCEVDDKASTLYANFHGYNPNEELVEINVRDACFYPDKPGMNYITVKGFRMSQSATQWSTATDEQIGLIGTHWSKGWIIENNVISNSKNAGITLGKDRKSGHQAWAKEPNKPGYLIYNEVILRALLESGWNKDNVGSHIVRNNTIFDCEKNGIHGSLGAVFSRIENNHIYNIYTKRQFSGADIAGIKFLGAIDVLIKNNCIHNAFRGIWMDWMAQGTHITRNLCYNNFNDDLFCEVDHGPYLVDNNIFLSETGFRDMSQGGAIVHNLISGRIIRASQQSRMTPYHKPHSTMLAGFDFTHGGDNRFYNNIFVAGNTEISVINTSSTWTRIGYGLGIYNDAELPMQVSGNVYYKGAKPYVKETNFVNQAGIDPQIKILEENGGVYLYCILDKSFKALKTKFITTQLLGKAIIPDQAFENPDGSPLKIDKDYSDNKRNENNPSAGPFENPEVGKQLKLKVW